MYQREKRLNWIIFTVLTVSAIIVFFPLYITLVNSFKSYNEVVSSVASLPSTFHFNNFKTVWNQLNFGGVFLNSLIITVVSVVGILMISAPAAYQFVRRPGWVSTFLFMLILSALVIPFQSLMIPLVKVASDLNIMDSIPGIIIMYWGFGIPLAVFLYHGFVKSIPRELEEAAMIDGNGVVGAFYRIVLPLLKPVTTTIAILHSLWIWNDFLLPLITLSSEKNRTIPIASSVYFGQYLNEWHLAMAALTMASIPVIIFFIFMQRNIIDGITAGAVKG
ncbi:raffinose/stachyose/melibiose transport system permease protein [Paenibacillus anaericanus]|uniref:carbohydrate ABC transporter permease n=1 Tax=Paenibacillus anaericanus TaxID=170367 RepID=UPI002787E500|nr:carbohydrate ABC transporter permease [Paenibacillus anaericanus]MDQ0087409.1 raffinose/stachyose/melibiose transport system permease protein [Paenibacillus anaericanus]